MSAKEHGSRARAACKGETGTRHDVRRELIAFAAKAAQAMSPGSLAGCFSARDGATAWVTPRDIPVAKLAPADLCGFDAASRTPAKSRREPPPPAETGLHFDVYEARPDAAAVFFARLHFTSMLIDKGRTLKPMFAEFVNDLGRTGHVALRALLTMSAKSRKAYFREHDTIFIPGHGVLAVGVRIKQAYFRIVVAEDAAKSMIAALIVGRPKLLTKRQAGEILSLDAVQHRTKMVEKSG